MVCYTLTESEFTNSCIAGYVEDPYFASVYKACLEGGQEGKTAHKKLMRYSLKDGLLLKKGRICIPDVEELRLKVLFGEHDELTRGHPGIFKTWKFMVKKYYWPGMRKDVEDYIKSCEKSYKNKSA